MTNGINERQNEEKSICLLGAQRQLYNYAKKVDNLRIFMSVFLPLFLAIIELLVSDNIVLSVVSYCVSITSMLIGLLVRSYIKMRKKLAAEIQQNFDLYVYQMPWDSKLFGGKRDITYEVMVNSGKLFQKTGERNKLMNWYTDVVESVDIKKGIILCQKENFYWDVALRKRFRRLSIIVVSVIVAAIIIFNSTTSDSILKSLGMLAFIFPMIQWLIEIVKNINDDIENLEECDKLISSSKQHTMDELQVIQKHIYEHRKNCFIIPNWFYKRNKENDEDLAHRSASMEVN